MLEQVDRVEAAMSGDEPDCTEAREAAEAGRRRAVGLSARVDEDLKQNLVEWFEHLEDEARQECRRSQQEQDEEETPTPTPTATATEEPEPSPTATPTATQTPEATPTSEPTPGATVDPGGAGAPEDEGGDE